MVGRQTPHTSFYLNKLKIHMKKGEKEGGGGDENSTTLYHKR
jgi:hypothetical protein